MSAQRPAPSFHWDSLVTDVTAEKNGGEFVIDNELGDRLRTMATECHNDAVLSGLERLQHAFGQRLSCRRFIENVSYVKMIRQICDSCAVGGGGSSSSNIPGSAVPANGGSSSNSSGSAVPGNGGSSSSNIPGSAVPANGGSSSNSSGSAVPENGGSSSSNIPGSAVPGNGGSSSNSSGSAVPGNGGSSSSNSPGSAVPGNSGSGGSGGGENSSTRNNRTSSRVPGHGGGGSSSSSSLGSNSSGRGRTDSISSSGSGTDDTVAFDVQTATTKMMKVEKNAPLMLRNWPKKGRYAINGEAVVLLFYPTTSEVVAKRGSTIVLAFPVENWRRDYDPSDNKMTKQRAKKHYDLGFTFGQLRDGGIAVAPPDDKQKALDKLNVECNTTWTLQQWEQCMHRAVGVREETGTRLPNPVPTLRWEKTSTDAETSVGRSRGGRRSGGGGSAGVGSRRTNRDETSVGRSRGGRGSGGGGSAGVGSRRTNRDGGGGAGSGGGRSATVRRGGGERDRSGGRGRGNARDGRSRGRGRGNASGGRIGGARGGGRATSVPTLRTLLERGKVFQTLAFPRVEHTISNPTFPVARFEPSTVQLLDEAKQTYHCRRNINEVKGVFGERKVGNKVVRNFNLGKMVAVMRDGTVRTAPEKDMLMQMKQDNGVKGMTLSQYLPLLRQAAKIAEDYRTRKAAKEKAEETAARKRKQPAARNRKGDPMAAGAKRVCGDAAGNGGADGSGSSDGENGSGESSDADDGSGDSSDAGDGAGNSSDAGDGSCDSSDAGDDDGGCDSSDAGDGGCDSSDAGDGAGYSETEKDTRSDENDDDEATSADEEQQYDGEYSNWG